MRLAALLCEAGQSRLDRRLPILSADQLSATLAYLLFGHPIPIGALVSAYAALWIKARRRPTMKEFFLGVSQRRRGILQCLIGLAILYTPDQEFPLLSICFITVLPILGYMALEAMWRDEPATSGEPTAFERPTSTSR